MNEENMFCVLSDLHNEADVETLFLDRLLLALNYPDGRIKRKETIAEITIGKGVKKEKYRPDYALLDSAGNTIIVLDAKSPDEKPIDYHYQVSSYALYINQKYPDKNPVRYTAVANGNEFYVWPWDSEQAIFYLRFSDFKKDGEKYLELKSNISYDAFKQVVLTKDIFEYERPEITTLTRKFNEIHNIIRKKEGYSPTDAFYELCKLMFIKIQEDNRLHKLIEEGKTPQKSDFVFSTDWINEQVRLGTSPNPFNTILFSKIHQYLEREIEAKEKKRIFEESEQLKPKASTIYEVVELLQHDDLYGVNEDLNGRMFETFLSATIRGRELGQFFTPRGVVHYMVVTADMRFNIKNTLEVDEDIPYVSDGCCGSGGFLIDTMAELEKHIKSLTQLTNHEKKTYIKALQMRHLFGIEKTDKITRVARLNMYLHGDGGAKIFHADTLDTKIEIDEGANDEIKGGLTELRNHLIDAN